MVLKQKGVTERDLRNFARQIASGMKHLEDKHVVHRDLVSKIELVRPSMEGFECHLPPVWIYG